MLAHGCQKVPLRGFIKPHLAELSEKPSSGSTPVLALGTWAEEVGERSKAVTEEHLAEYRQHPGLWEGRRKHESASQRQDEFG